MTLYELTGQMLELQEMLESGDYDEDVIADTLEGVQFEFEEKADGYAKIIRNLTADAEGLKVEIDRMTERKRLLENRIKTLKNRLEDAFIQTGTEKLKTQLFSFSMQNNPPKVVLDTDDIFSVPDDLLKYSDPELDKTKAKEFLKNNEADWGHLEQGKSLRIR